MRIVVYEFTSLDGVVQAPGGPDEDTDGGFAHGGWSHPYFDPGTMGPVISAGLEAADALLFGRRTWEGMAAAWPERAGDPFADRMNALGKYVVSSTLPDEERTWNTQVLRGVDEVAELRNRAGGDVNVWGSATLVRSLLAEGLVDGLVLMVEPIVLGGGKRIFPEDGQARPLRLVEAVTAATGTLVCTYEPAV